MKRIVCIMALAFAVIGTAFAQAKPADAPTGSKEPVSSVSLDLFPLLKGFIASGTSDDEPMWFCVSVSYEKLLKPHWSMGGNIDLYLSDIDITYFGLAVQVRYYYMSEKFEKFFTGATLGYNRESIKGTTIFEGLNTSLQAGYKIITSKNISIEPSMSYVLSKFGEGLSPLGWQGGLRFGLLF